MLMDIPSITIIKVKCLPRVSLIHRTGSRSLSVSVRNFGPSEEGKFTPLTLRGGMGVGLDNGVSWDLQDSLMYTVE